jgi:hypothetical protein
MDDGNTPDGYLYDGDGWNWNRAKFRVDGKKLEDLVDGLVKVKDKLSEIARLN